MTAPRATDLPIGSVIAGRSASWIKTQPAPWAAWACSDGGHYSNSQVEAEMVEGGAQVLRVGDGSDQ